MPRTSAALRTVDRGPRTASRTVHAPGTNGRRKETKAVWGGTAPQFLIPEGSVFSEFVRNGAEGFCLACNKPIRAHFGHRGAWLGCQDKNVPVGAMFMLVPVALPVERRHQLPTTTSHDRGVAVARTIPTPRTGATPQQEVTRFNAASLKPRYVYTLKDRRMKAPDTLSAAMRDAFEGLKKSALPVNAEDAAKLAKRPKEANRRCLNLLTEFGLAIRTDVSQVQE